MSSHSPPKTGQNAAAPARRAVEFVERRNLAEDVLNSIGECVYEWNIETDAMVWSEGAVSLLCLPDAERISSDRVFSSLLRPETESTRGDTIHSRFNTH